MDDVALFSRTGLPDALRVLLDEYPRAGWADDPGFDGLIRFWLDRHMMFRRLMREMSNITEGLLDKKVDSDRYAAQLARYGGMFVNGLHEHHTIEDTHYFPKLATKDRRIKRGFDILDKDHHDLDGLLSDFVGGANEAIQARQKPSALYEKVGAFQKELIRLDGLLDRHLVDEEELIVPVILKFGSPAM